MARKPSPTDEEVREWIRMYVEDSLSFLVLGLEVGRDPSTVRSHCLRLGLEPRPPGGPGRDRTLAGPRGAGRAGAGPRSAIVRVPRSSGGHRRRRSW